VKLDLPVDSQNNTPPPIDPVKNKIVVDPAGTVTWNGAPVNEVQLRQFLDLTQQMSPGPGASPAAASGSALRSG
jgi:biopolymer transport protein ExbD